MLPLAILLTDPKWLPPSSRILVGATCIRQAHLLDCLKQVSKAPARACRRIAIVCSYLCLQGRAKRQMPCTSAAMRLCTSTCFSATGAGASALGSQSSSTTHGCPAGGGSGAEGGLQGQAGGLRGAGHPDRGCDRGHPPAQAAAGDHALLWACAIAVPLNVSRRQQVVS